MQASTFDRPAARGSSSESRSGGAPLPMSCNPTGCEQLRSRQSRPDHDRWLRIRAQPFCSPAARLPVVTMRLYMADIGRSSGELGEDGGVVDTIVLSQQHRLG